ncbi:MAG: sulfur carrier protein ThiS [Pirellulaceae bacterium]
MQIVFNGQERETADDITVAALLEELKLPPKRVAVEVNLELVARDQHAACVLQEGDQLEVVTLVGGG